MSVPVFIQDDGRCLPDAKVLDQASRQPFRAHVTRIMAISYEPPIARRLRGYAFDPSLSLMLDTVEVNDLVYEVDWEADLAPGPVGEYLEVIDYDPTTGTMYTPVDLNDINVVAQEGVRPSESNPLFHQQMVYAVAMTTIRNFERALGRKILWAPRLVAEADVYERYVQRLRLYPHALREANAYYSPLKKAILFGYFAASPADQDELMPGSLVFTCLSHDIIAHEVTHAILDGLHRNYNRPSNPDVLAFHEGFADIVALFQHFTFPDVLKHQIAKTRGDLKQQNLLGQLAREFGKAVGGYGSLRDALGHTDPETNTWIPHEPDPRAFHTELSPHRRGSILVAAVFDAFLSIYKRRVADLLRMASGGREHHPERALHPDLVDRLAQAASKTAQHVLSMCIRALDYCPPVDLTFGDYLQAIITADQDLVHDDHHHYRLAFINAFRQRGIYPEGIKTLSEESLCYPAIKKGHHHSDTTKLFNIIAKFLREYRADVLYAKDRKEVYDTSKAFITGNFKRRRKGLHERLWVKFDNSYEFEKLTGLVFNRDWRNHGIRGEDKPSYQILNLRLVSRVGPDGDQVNQIVFGLVQRMGIQYKDGAFDGHYIPGEEDRDGRGDEGQTGDLFEVQGGCTLIFDLDRNALRYAIAKPLLSPQALDQDERSPNHDRIARQYQYQTEVLPTTLSALAQHFYGAAPQELMEPFALLHTH